MVSLGQPTMAEQCTTANEIVRLRTCRGTWVAAAADKRRLVQSADPSDRSTAFAVVPCGSGAALRSAATGQYVDLDRGGAALRQRRRPASWAVVNGRGVARGAPPALSALRLRGLYASAAADGSLAAAPEATDASLFFVEAWRYAATEPRWCCKCAHAMLDGAHRRRSRARAAAWRGRRILVVLRGAAARPEVGFHYGDTLPNLDACVLAELRSLGAAVSVFAACKRGDGLAAAVAARGYAVAGDAPPDPGLQQWPAALATLRALPACDGVLLLRPDVVWLAPLGDWGLDPDRVTFPFREPWAGEGATCDVFHYAPGPRVGAFVAALEESCRRPPDPLGTCDEPGRDLRAQALLYGHLGDEDVAFCVEDGVYPSGEVGATNSLCPNPLYAFAGRRAMCHRGHLGHIPRRGVAPAAPPYALGDMVSGAWAARERRDAFLAAYPDSVGAAYLRETDARSDYAVLARLVRDRRKPPFPDVAVHLRTGDVVDAAAHSVAELLAAPRPFFNGGFYVRPAAFYEALELPAGSEITLFTGFHLPAKSRAKSLAYVAAVRGIFERRGFAVAEAVGGDADGDLARMVFAATFVPSGGGFSALIAGTRRALLEI